jgi:hypothetical protein
LTLVRLILVSDPEVIQGRETWKWLLHAWFWHQPPTQLPGDEFELTLVRVHLEQYVKGTHNGNQDDC